MWKPYTRENLIVKTENTIVTLNMGHGHVARFSKDTPAHQALRSQRSIYHLRPIHTTRVHGPCSRASVHSTRVHGPWTQVSFLSPVFTARVHGVGTHYPCSRAVNTGRVEKKHCRAMFFSNTARETGSVYWSLVALYSWVETPSWLPPQQVLGPDTLW